MLYSCRISLFLVLKIEFKINQWYYCMKSLTGLDTGCKIMNYGYTGTLTGTSWRFGRRVWTVKTQLRVMWSLTKLFVLPTEDVILSFVRAYLKI